MGQGLQRIARQCGGLIVKSSAGTVAYSANGKPSKAPRLIIPRYVEAAYDPLQHKTQTDIAWLVRHELDLFEEGEESDIKSLANATRARQFLAKYLPPR